MKVAVVGLGKLGACLAGVLSTQHQVVGIDTNPDTVRDINNSVMPKYLDEPNLEQLIKHGDIYASAHIEEAMTSEFIFVIVPTPSGTDNLFDASIVKKVLIDIFALYQGGDLGIVIVSTLTPETMEELDHIKTEVLGHHLPKLELIYSPLFVALGSVIRDLTHPDSLLIGTKDGISSAQVQDFIDLFTASVFFGSAPVHIMLWQEAELAKLFTNVMLSVKSLYANELAILAEASGVDSAPILKFAGADKRIGPKMMGAGFPPGGTCLPRDVRCIDAYSQKVQGTVLFGSLFGALSSGSVLQHQAIARDVESLLGINERVGILGLPYKLGTKITDESGSLILANTLYDQCGIVSYVYDPEVILSSKDYCVQIHTLENISQLAYVLVIGLPDPRYRDLLTPDLLEGHAIYDVWGILEQRQIDACECYRRFGKSI